VDRREFVAMLGVGLAATLAGCGAFAADEQAAPGPAGGGPPAPPGPATTTAAPATTAPVGLPGPATVPGPATAPGPGALPGPGTVPGPATVPGAAGGWPTAPAATSGGPAPRLPAIPPPRPGRPTIVSHAPRKTQQVALTIDDGYCDECVDGYVAIAELTGIHLTFSPNGVYRDCWEPRAKRLRGLIASGQVQIGNHTWSHGHLPAMSDGAIRRDIERNEAWIEKTFGITGRPWFRPPFGERNARTDELAAELGYTRILLWDGSFGDSQLLTPRVLLEQARLYLKPGVVMLGHANHPTAVQTFDRIIDLLASRHLEPATLDEMFGTSRATG
jgi:peptidoglycan/xylan/chitin deacetylase (PgdA/CDA1 family)